jgi:hypothetical protein
MPDHRDSFYFVSDKKWIINGIEKCFCGPFLCMMGQEDQASSMSERQGHCAETV